ncbi:DUF2845 domain-containing protein [Legionella sp. CNM-4043-24]|uniref:DUF2845 domain-containing protein n=1 Tax=Legionella sp. CNM-4043-24 TaxID=3421646 RepID=UPI00403AE76F
MNRTPRIMLAALFLCAGINTSFAMRCNGALVYEGDTKYLVEKKCGEPLAKDINRTPEVLYNDMGGAYASVINDYEIWTYQFSPTDFIYEVTFQDGLVISIRASRQ